MRIKHLLVCSFAIAVVLAGCASPVLTGAGSPTVPDAGATPTLSLLSSETPAPIKTVTPTLASIPTPSLQVTLDAVGDLMLGRTVGERVLAQGPQIVFAGVQSVLDSADVRVGNLECALTGRSTSERKMYTLQAPPEAAQALALGKFDVVSLANNHALDYGYQGLADTQNDLGRSGVATVGAGVDSMAAHTPVILERNGLRLAFLAYLDVPVEVDGFDAHDWVATASQPGIAWADPQQITADVAAARQVADVVIVFLHSGWENRTMISPGQRMEAHTAIDAGASLVIGTHSHMLQQTEMYHGGLIAYSLGNFVFDNYRGDSNQTAILRVVLVPGGVQSYEYIPALIENGLPRLVTYDQFPGIGTMVAPLAP